MHTVNEAKKKYCPIVMIAGMRDNYGARQRQCMIDDCAMWIWTETMKEEITGGEGHQRLVVVELPRDQWRGRCGLINFREGE
jgi:hypothetical protein